MERFFGISVTFRALSNKDSSQGHENSESHLFFGHRCTIIMFMLTWNLCSSEMTDIYKQLVAEV